MAQTTTKTATTKKTAILSKALPTAKKTAAAKPAPAKTAKAKPVSKASAKKPISNAVSVSTNGAVLTQKKTTKSASSSAVTPEQRYQMICDAAYFRAERRGFIGGSAEQDWIDAEMEVDQLLCAVRAPQPNH